MRPSVPRRPKDYARDPPLPPPRPRRPWPRPITGPPVVPPRPHQDALLKNFIFIMDDGTAASNNIQRWRGPTPATPGPLVLQPEFEISPDGDTEPREGAALLNDINNNITGRAPPASPARLVRQPEFGTSPAPALAAEAQGLALRESNARDAGAEVIQRAWRTSIQRAWHSTSTCSTRRACRLLTAEIWADEAHWFAEEAKEAAAAAVRAAVRARGRLPTALSRLRFQREWDRLRAAEEPSSEMRDYRALWAAEEARGWLDEMLQLTGRQAAWHSRRSSCATAVQRVFRGWRVRGATPARQRRCRAAAAAQAWQARACAAEAAWRAEAAARHAVRGRQLRQAAVAAVRLPKPGDCRPSRPKRRFAWRAAAAVVAQRGWRAAMARRRATQLVQAARVARARQWRRAPMMERRWRVAHRAGALARIRRRRAAREIQWHVGCWWAARGLRRALLGRLALWTQEEVRVGLGGHRVMQERELDGRPPRATEMEHASALMARVASANPKDPLLRSLRGAGVQQRRLRLAEMLAAAWPVQAIRREQGRRIVRWWRGYALRRRWELQLMAMLAWQDGQWLAAALSGRGDDKPVLCQFMAVDGALAATKPVPPADLVMVAAWEHSNLLRDLVFARDTTSQDIREDRRRRRRAVLQAYAAVRAAENQARAWVQAPWAPGHREGLEPWELLSQHKARVYSAGSRLALCLRDADATVIARLQCLARLREVRAASDVRALEALLGAPGVGGVDCWSDWHCRPVPAGLADSCLQARLRAVTALRRQLARSGAATLLERYGGVWTTLLRESGHPWVVIRLDSPRTFTKRASWDEGQRLRVTKAAAAAATEAAVAEDQEAQAAMLASRARGAACRQAEEAWQAALFMARHAQRSLELAYRSDVERAVDAAAAMAAAAAAATKSLQSEARGL